MECLIGITGSIGTSHLYYHLRMYLIRVTFIVGRVTMGSDVYFLVFIIESHLQSYSCSTNINYLWNIGFFIFSILGIQIVSGILLSLHYTSDINYSYYSIILIIREVYYGWYLHYIHSSGVSLIFSSISFHIGRGLYVSSFVFNSNLWLSGVVLFLF